MLTPYTVSYEDKVALRQENVASQYKVEADNFNQIKAAINGLNTNVQTLDGDLEVFREGYVDRTADVNLLFTNPGSSYNLADPPRTGTIFLDMNAANLKIMGKCLVRHNDGSVPTITPLNVASPPTTFSLIYNGSGATFADDYQTGQDNYIEFTLINDQEDLTVTYKVIRAGAAGPAGPAGADGADGATIHPSAGAPDDGIGVDGDWAINTLTGVLYGPKAGGTWTGVNEVSLSGLPGESAYQAYLNQGGTGSESDFLASLVGPAGAQGPQGPAGSGGYTSPSDSLTSATLTFTETLEYVGTEVPITGAITIDLTGQSAKEAVGKFAVVHYFGSDIPTINIAAGSKAIWHESGKIGQSDMASQHDASEINIYTFFVKPSASGTSSIDYIVEVAHTDFFNSPQNEDGEYHVVWSPDPTYVDDITVSEAMSTLTGAAGTNWGEQGIKALRPLLSTQDFELKMEFMADPVGNSNGIGLEVAGVPDHSHSTADIFVYAITSNGYRLYDQENGQSNLLDSDTTDFEWDQDVLFIRVQGTALTIGRMRSGVDASNVYSATITRQDLYPIFLTRGNTPVKVTINLL